VANPLPGATTLDVIADQNPRLPVREMTCSTHLTNLVWITRWEHHADIGHVLNFSESWPILLTVITCRTVHGPCSTNGLTGILR
jgi:hypothetical protein